MTTWEEVKGTPLGSHYLEVDHDWPLYAPV